jgi:hypothetical protein
MADVYEWQNNLYNDGEIIAAPCTQGRSENLMIYVTGESLRDNEGQYKSCDANGGARSNDIGIGPMLGEAYACVCAHT